MKSNSCYELDLKDLTPSDIEECYGPFVDIDTVDSYGDTLLLASCKNKNIKHVKHYLELGANPNFLNDCGESPLHVVIDTASHDEEVSLKIIELLISSGADLELRAYMNKTPFLRASCRECINVLKVLVNAGCDVDATVSEYGEELDAIWFSETFHLSKETRQYIKEIKAK